MDDLLSAIRKRLATYLLTELTSSFTGIDVWEYWPPAGQPLKKYTVTVTEAGQGDEDLFGPFPIAVAPIANTPNANVTWVYGRAEIPFSLNAWADTPVNKRALAGALQAKMNRPPQATVPGLTGTGLRKPDVAPGLVLRLDNYDGQLCSFRSNAAIVPSESSVSAIVSEWRTSWAGVADALMTMTTVVPLIKALKLKIRATDGAYDITTLT